MTKFNSNTVILSDLDGVILDLNYDIKFWKEWLPAELPEKSDKPIEEIKNELDNKFSIPGILNKNSGNDSFKGLFNKFSSNTGGATKSG